MDVAALGMAVDSSQADKGALALNRLTTAAKRAEVATAKAAFAQADATLAAAKATATSTSEDIKAAIAAKNKAAATLAAAKAAAAMASATQASSAVIAAQANAIRTGFATALNQAVQSINATKTANQALAVSMQSLQTPANKSAAAIKNSNAALAMNRQLMFQMVDVAQGIPLAFQSPVFGLQNLGIQMAQIGQLYYGQGGMKAAFRDMTTMVGKAGAAIFGFLTPSRVLAGGIIAIGITLAASAISWLSYGKRLDDVAKQADTTTKSLSALNNAAAGKGIGDDDFLSAIQKMSEGIYDAKSGAGALAELLHVNGKRAGTLEETLSAVADIIAKANSNQQAQNLLRQAGLPADQQWVNFMKQGGSAIQEAVRQATAFGGEANDNMIAAAKRFDEQWNKAIRSLKVDFQSFFMWFIQQVQTVGFGINQIVVDFQRFVSQRGQLGSFAKGMLKSAYEGRAGTSLSATSNVDELYGRTGAGGAPTRITVNKGNGAADPEQIRRSIQAQQAYLGILGQTLTVQQQIKSVELQIAQYHLDPANKRLSEDQITNLKRLAEERALGIDQIKAGTDAYNVEAAAIGMSTEKAAAYALVQNQINAAIRNGNPLKAEEIAKIEQSASAYEAAATKANNLRFAKDAVKGFLSDLRQGLQNGEGFWKSFGNAALNVLNKIIDKIEGKLVDALFSLNSAGPGAGGGFLGGIFKMFGFAKGGVMTSGGPLALKRYAKGGVATSPQLAMYGEGDKPEAYVPLPDGRRIPVNIKTNGSASGGGGGNSVVFAPTIDARGASVDAVQRMEKALATTTQTLAKHLSSHDTLVQSSVTTFRRNNPGAT